MTIDELKSIVEYDEPAFEYKGKEYVILFLDNKYQPGETNSKDDFMFDTFEAMINDWIIDGKPLREIITEIQLY